MRKLTLEPFDQIIFTLGEIHTRITDDDVVTLAINDRTVNESLEKLKAELAAQMDEDTGPEIAKFTDDPVAFNAQVAKLLGKKLKKDAGASAVRQNYKGTGKQAHRRQIYINIGDAAGVDVWLDTGYVKIGGVLSPPPGHESRKMMGDMTPEQVYQWLSGTLKQMYAGFAKQEGVKIVDAHRDDSPNVLEALRLSLEAKKAKVPPWPTPAPRRSSLSASATTRSSRRKRRRPSTR